MPFCDDCIALRRSKGRRQVLFERVAVANGLLLALAAGARVYVTHSSEYSMYSERGQVWGALLAALVVQIVFGITYAVFLPWSRRFRSPATRAALAAVTIVDFGWETTTLGFENAEYAERFAQVNPALSQEASIGREPTRKEA